MNQYTDPTTEKDLLIRQEFAKAFDWYSREDSYGYSQSSKKLKEPTWMEIFVELGKILKTSEINTDIQNTIRRTIKDIQQEQNICQE